LTQAEGPGLILFRGGNYSEQEAVDRLRRALETVPSEELPDSIVIIERGEFVVDVFRLNHSTEANDVDTE
jgi:hypothetical protein